VEKDSKGIMRHLSGRGGAVKLGLAASSLALVAGRTAVPGHEGAASDSPVAPASENSTVKQVSWDLPAPAADNDRVQFFIEYLMGKNHDKTQQWLERIGKYGPMIQNELKERDMPQDLLYLAMIESGLSPHATSPVKAAGMWQFMQETGERYGLRVNSYIDERRDPIESTAAALTYLQQMHERFGSWFLSAAGYNTGENRVGRLVKERIGVEKADTEDMYWQIWDKLPGETRDYVPLMLAMGTIAKEPAKYGFKALTPQAPLRYEEVSIAGGTKLSDVALMAGVNAKEVEELNPHLIRKMTPPGSDYKVRVPVGRSQTVLAALGGSAHPGGASGISSEGSHGASAAP
jgi:membrane-bound lytic murein transglycosylase D